MTQRARCFAFLLLLTLAPTGQRASGQDSLADIAKSAQITARQRATMEAELSIRVKRLKDAGSNSSLRAEAKERILRTAQTAGASRAFLDAYAEICANELTSLITGDALEPAAEALLILMDLDNAATSDALVEGLGAKHASVRLMSARAIQRLHGKLSGDGGKSRAVLRALGRAGAKESDEFVLRVIYQAIDFKASAKSFSAADAAEALVTVFDARVQSLASGSRDELKDEAGIEVAARCYADAKPGDKARLIGSMSAFIDNALTRYFDPDTAPEYLATLSRMTTRIEEAVRDMAKASGVNLSCDRLKLNPRASDRMKQEPDARKVLDCINKALSGNPWNIN